MSQFQERALTDEERAEFDSRATQDLKNLGVADTGATPESIVGLVDAYVDKWQTGGFLPKRSLFNRKPAAQLPDTVDVALGLGAVWGNQIVKQFGWEWVCLEYEDVEYYCVVSPNRAWVIYPTYFLKACLDNPDGDCTAMLAFNMMLAGNIPEGDASSYENVMAGVHRIVPKR